MKLKDVLIIENDQDMANRVTEEFEKHNVKIIHVVDDKDMEEKLINYQFQMVILDWFLDDTSSDLAKLCLIKIRQCCFLPVVIWTEEINIFNNEEEDVYKIFPQAMIHACSKEDVGYEKLHAILQEKHASPPLNFAEDLLQTIEVSTKNTLYTLAEHSLNDLAMGLKTLLAAEESPQIDIEHTIQVLTTLIEREIFKDNNFIEKLEATIKNLSFKPNEGQKPKNMMSKIQDLYLFYNPPEKDNIIRTGDLVEIDMESNGKPITKQAIVITPACDLANPEKTIFLRLAFIEGIPDLNKFIRSDAEWLFIYQDERFFVSFHQLIVVKNLNLERIKEENKQNIEKKKALMSFTDSFTTLDNNNIGPLRRIRRLGEPYLSDLLHKFVSHAGRIGQPSFSAETLV